MPPPSSTVQSPLRGVVTTNSASRGDARTPRHIASNLRSPIDCEMQLPSPELCVYDQSSASQRTPLCIAIEMLWKAHCYAVDAGAGVWDFAVELEEFHRERISSSELRWLLARGCVQHGTEIATSKGRRVFRLHKLQSFSAASCFVITDIGIALAESCKLTEKFDLRCVSSFELPPRATPSRALKLDSDSCGIPLWDPLRRELWIDGRLVKQLRRPAINQQMILDNFQAEEWPHKIYNPIPLRPAICPKRCLHDAIKCLNRGHLSPAIRFSGDGSGCGVLWARVD